MELDPDMLIGAEEVQCKSFVRYKHLPTACYIVTWVIVLYL